MQVSLNDPNSDASLKGISPNPAMMNGRPIGAPQNAMATGMDGNAEYYTGNRMPGGAAGGPPMEGGPQAVSQTGNHALQDYQMQLMLLEQQNKKRLLLARQEQDHTGNPHPLTMQLHGGGGKFTMQRPTKCLQDRGVRKN
jgi:hypothetical protein